MKNKETETSQTPKGEVIQTTNEEIQRLSKQDKVLCLPSYSKIENSREVLKSLGYTFRSCGKDFIILYKGFAKIGMCSYNGIYTFLNKTLGEEFKLIVDNGKPDTINLHSVEELRKELKKHKQIAKKGEYAQYDISIYQGIENIEVTEVYLK